MRLLVTPLAEEDLEAIGDYIALDNPSRAVSFIEELREAFARIAGNYMAYRLRPDLGDEVRICIHGNYLIILPRRQKKLLSYAFCMGQGTLRPF